MATAFIFHGVGGNSQENWFPWLKEQLEAQGMKVIVPGFPNADHPDFAAWTKHLSQYESQISEDSIFIGHSLGGAFAMRVLETLKHPIAATFLVSSVSGVMGNIFDPLMVTFTEKPFDWEKVHANAGRVFVIHGDDDPYIRADQAKHLAALVRAELTMIPGGGHLNASAGYREFPLLLEKILS